MVCATSKIVISFRNISYSNLLKLIKDGIVCMSHFYVIGSYCYAVLHTKEGSQSVRLCEVCRFKIKEEIKTVGTKRKTAKKEEEKKRKRRCL